MKQGEIEKMAIPIQQNLSTLESRVMSDIVRRIRANGNITSAADWQVNRLYQMGVSKKEIKKHIAEALDLNKKEIKKLYRDALYNEYIRNEQLYKEKGAKWIPFSKNTDLHELIASIEEQTNRDLKNITQSLGFAIRGSDGRIIQSPIMDFYQGTLDDAMMDIASGEFDYNTVLNRTIKTMTDSGLRTIDYASGWSNRVEVAGRRAVMTGFNQLQAKMNEQVAKQLNTDYFEVSWHGGARPEHQVWQGRVYSRKQLETVCGLGSITGLCGANCYHQYNAFIPGVSVRTYTDAQLDQMNAEENRKKAYNGKEYTTYEALQQQRKMETLMRKQRQDIRLLKDGDADDDAILAAKVRYRVTMEKYSDFSGKMNLPQQKERVYMDGLGQMVSGKEVAKGAKSGYNTGRIQDGKNYSAAIRSEEKKIRSDKIETAVLLNDRGDIIFRESSGAANYVQFSKEQLDKMKGATLTHNHPSNSTFSAEDVGLMVIRDLKAIRATGKERTYQLSKMNNGDFKNGLAEDYKTAMANNRKITDAEYEKLTKQYNGGNIGHTEYSERVQGLNVILNQLNSKWLKENSKKYGYRYSVIERRKGNA